MKKDFCFRCRKNFWFDPKRCRKCRWRVCSRCGACGCVYGKAFAAVPAPAVSPVKLKIANEPAIAVRSYNLLPKPEATSAAGSNRIVAPRHSRPAPQMVRPQPAIRVVPAVAAESARQGTAEKIGHTCGQILVAVFVLLIRAAGGGSK